MATNPPSGDGHRNGAVRKRSQVYNPKTEQWVKRDKDTGRFMDVKQDGTPFKGVRKTLSKILCKWKQDSVVGFFLYLDSVFKKKHKLIHNQSPV